MEIEQFGKIDIGSLEECYDAVFQIQGDNVRVDLNFESESIESSDLEKIRKFLFDIEIFANKAFEAISENFDLGGESEAVRFYLQHHLKEFTEDIIMEIFGTTDIDKQTFFKHLRLYRVGLYPEDDESYAIFDIQLPTKYTNYLLAVTFDSEGEFSCISMES